MMDGQLAVPTMATERHDNPAFNSLLHIGEGGFH